MRNKYILHDNLAEPDHLESINTTLRLMQQQLLKELTYKQEIITAKEQEILKLSAQLEKKETQLQELTQKVEEVKRNNEGNKQLTKKLLNDLVRKQQDIEWYKRTYETRSFFGILKQKFFQILD